MHVVKLVEVKFCLNQTEEGEARAELKMILRADGISKPHNWLRRLLFFILYIQIEQAILELSNDDEHNVTATNGKEEMKKLLSVGFEYICQRDDILCFRKRK